jgi:hypothetical protein
MYQHDIRRKICDAFSEQCRGHVCTFLSTLIFHAVDKLFDRSFVMPIYDYSAQRSSGTAIRTNCIVSSNGFAAITARGNSRDTGYASFAKQRPFRRTSYTEVGSKDIDEPFQYVHVVIIPL